MMTSNGDEHKSQLCKNVQPCQCVNITTELTGSITRIRLSMYCVCVEYDIAATLVNWAVCRGNSLKTSLNLNVLDAVPYMKRESNIYVKLAVLPLQKKLFNMHI